MQYIIRRAIKEDMNQVHKLICELAVFENEPDAVKITKETLVQFGIGNNALFTCFIAENEGVILGMALVYFRFSTWEGKALHLEDLIVSNQYRNKGIGKALYNQVMVYADQEDVNRVEWEVLDWNTNAIDFYEKSGVTFFKDWHLVQMNKNQLNTYLKSIQE